ncbi:hypothetical protein BASA83_002012 [Batrachochytrium salamandrivorans]|nr:hypothetical protein BASA83_002012 [Batrachochytrium salamandrivorans]
MLATTDDSGYEHNRPSPDMIHTADECTESADISVLLGQLLQALATPLPYSWKHPLTSISHGHLLFWTVDPAIAHPLRDIIGAPTFVIVSVKDTFAVDPSDVLDLCWKDVVHVGRNARTGESQNDSHGRIAIPACKWKSLIPIPLDECRHLLSEIMLQSEHQITVPIIAYTVSTTKEPLYYGLWPVNGKSLTIISLSYRGDVGFSGHHVASFKSIIPDIKEIPSKATCSAKYEILARPILMADDGKSYSTIDLNVAWDEYDLKPLCKPLNPSKSILTILNEPGCSDPESYVSLSHIRQQLNTLITWNRIRQDDPEWSSCSSDSRADTDPPQSNFPLSESVDAFLTEIKTSLETLNDPRPVTKVAEQSESNLTSSLCDFSPLKQREGYDFAEQVWIFCQRGRSRGDITDALTAIIEELETGRVLPCVAKDNLSNLANIIRSCLKVSVQKHAMDTKEQRDSIAATFDFWLEQPLECLVDAGLWKLKRDYEFYLLENNITSRHQLEFFMDASLSFDDQIVRLHCLHRTLELVLLIKSNILVLPVDILRSIVQSTLRYYIDLIEKHAESSISEGMILNVDKPLVVEVELPKFSAVVQKAVSTLTNCFEVSFWKAIFDAGVRHGRSMSHHIVLDGTNCLLSQPLSKNMDLHDSTFAHFKENMDSSDYAWNAQDHPPLKTLVIKLPTPQ